MPLKGISVRLEVKGFVADLSASLEYVNEELDPLEAMFVFPMDSDSAVYHFQAQVGGKTIVASLKEKEQAKDEYDDAISSGRQAFLLHEDESSSDVFRCSVGNLPPGDKVTVSFRLVQELPLEADGAVRFTLPAVLNPRYTPAGTQGPKITSASAPVDKLPYTLQLEADFHNSLGISRVQSNCGVTPVEFLNPEKTSAKLSLADGHGFDRDVEFLIYCDKIHEPSAVVEGGLETAAQGTLMGEAAVMVNLFPSFSQTASNASVGEFIFLMDRSGSMGSQMSQEDKRPRIECARETLLLLVKSLPMGCYFNIYGFGSSFASFFPTSVEYTQSSTREALDKLKAVSADMGGTEILQPLSAIYRTARVTGHPRQLFVFTDGEVSNTKAVLAEVQKHSSTHRCFSFGIGEGASTALIKGMAKAASGNCEFISGKQRMQPKVLQALRYALQPSGTGLTLSWELPPGVEAAPLVQPPTELFNGKRTIIYAQLKGKLDPSLEAAATLTYSLGEQQIRTTTRFRLAPLQSGSATIHRLAAKGMIGQLEVQTAGDPAETSRRLVELSVQASVVSSKTAFIAINTELNQPLQGPLRHRHVPLYHAAQMKSLMAPMSCQSNSPMMMAMGFAESIEPQACFQGPMDSMACQMDSPPMMAKKCSKGQKMKIRNTRDVAEKLSKIRSASYCKSAYCDSAIDSAFICPPPPPPLRGGASSVPTPSCPPPEEDEEDEEGPWLKLVALQNADGSWGPEPGLGSALGLTIEQIKLGRPRQDLELTLWATILAVIWLHSFAADTKLEWDLLVNKSLSWVKATGAPDLADCVKAANALLKTCVLPETLGL